MAQARTVDLPCPLYHTSGPGMLGEKLAKL
jgi:hypothetical protein